MVLLSVQAKVGAFAIGGLLLLGASVLGLKGIDFGAEEKLTFYVGFQQVLGLEPKSMVRLSGVPIGKVASIANDGSGVTLTLEVGPDVKIPKDSKFGTASNGVMGAKFINISPGVDNGDYIKNGDYVYGENETGMDAIFEGMARVMQKVEGVLENVDSVVGNDKLKSSVIGITEEMNEAAVEAKLLMQTLNRMAGANEGNINEIISEMNRLVKGMNATVDNVEHMTGTLDNFVSDPKTVGDLRATLENISSTSKDIASIASNMNTALGDPETAENIKETIKNARSVSEKADRMLGKVSKISVKPSVGVMYSDKNRQKGKSDWSANLGVEVGYEKNYLNLGVEDVGNKTKFNAQVGRKFGKNFGAHAGIIAGKLGAGVDAYAGDRFKFTAETYDPNDAKLRLRAELRVLESTFLVGEYRNVERKKNRAAYVGIKQEF